MQRIALVAAALLLTASAAQAQPAPSAAPVTSPVASPMTSPTALRDACMALAADRGTTAARDCRDFVRGFFVAEQAADDMTLTSDAAERPCYRLPDGVMLPFGEFARRFVAHAERAPDVLQAPTAAVAFRAMLAADFPCRAAPAAP